MLNEETHFALLPDGKFVRFPSLGKARAFIMNKDHVFTSIDDVMKLSSERINMGIRQVYKFEAKDACRGDKKRRAANLWNGAIKWAPLYNPWAKKPKQGTQKALNAGNKYKVTHIFQTNTQKVTPQITAMLNYILEVHPEPLTEDELKIVINQAADAGVLKTKQDPWHIFKYYRKQMFDKGFLEQVE